MKYFIFLILSLTILSSCNHFDTIVGSTKRRVVYQRPYSFINRNEGGQIHTKVFGPGQWDHACAGPTIGYDFDVAQEQWECVTPVVMKDKLSINAKWVWQYRLKDEPNVLKDALFNFTPLFAIVSYDKDKKYEIHDENELISYQVISDQIFNTYAAPFANLAFKDVLCTYNSSGLNTEEVAKKGHENALRVLKDVKYPRFTVTPTGEVKFSLKDSICILDILDLTGVTFNKYEMPGEVTAIISEVNTTRSDYQARLKDKERVNINGQTKVEKAAVMQKKNILMDKIIKENPDVLQFAAQQKLNELLQSGKIKAKLIVIPEGGAQVHVN